MNSLGWYVSCIPSVMHLAISILSRGPDCLKIPLSSDSFIGFFLYSITNRSVSSLVGGASCVPIFICCCSLKGEIAVFLRSLLLMNLLSLYSFLLLLVFKDSKNSPASLVLPSISSAFNFSLSDSSIFPPFVSFKVLLVYFLIKSNITGGSQWFLPNPVPFNIFNSFSGSFSFSLLNLIPKISPSFVL